MTVSGSGLQQNAVKRFKSLLKCSSKCVCKTKRIIAVAKVATPLHHTFYVYNLLIKCINKTSNHCRDSELNRLKKRKRDGAHVSPTLSSIVLMYFPKVERERFSSTKTFPCTLFSTTENFSRRKRINHTYPARKRMSGNWRKLSMNY